MMFPPYPRSKLGFRPVAANLECSVRRPDALLIRQSSLTLEARAMQHSRKEVGRMTKRLARGAAVGFHQSALPQF